MTKGIFNNIKIAGIAGVIPVNRVNNLIDHPRVSQEEKKKTIKLTGVTEYRKASPEVCASDLCQVASEKLFAEMNISPDTIDAILFVSQTPDYRAPSTACLLQDKLSCEKDTLAFDINLGCSGFVYGLYVACSFIQGGGLKRVLLLCGDTQTKISYEEDKKICFILGDAGTATLIEADPDAPTTVMTMMTDGGNYDKLIIPAGGFRNPSTSNTREIKRQPDGELRSDEHLFMDGMEIFNFSVTDVVKTIQNFMEEQNIDVNGIDYLVLHQANKFMTDKIARKLKFPLEKVPSSLEMFGNTSCASIPLTVVHEFSQMKPSGEKRCLLSGFGIGLSWGVVDIVLDNICCPPIGEL